MEQTKHGTNELTVHVHNIIIELVILLTQAICHKSWGIVKNNGFDTYLAEL